jgi:hypothetical protein
MRHGVARQPGNPYWLRHMGPMPDAVPLNESYDG